MVGLFFQRHATSSPELHRTHIERFDGHEAFLVTHTRTPQAARAIEAGDTSRLESLILANGSFTGRAVLAPMVNGLTDLAARQGRQVEITTYDDPFTGSRAYGQSYRTERYLEVLRHVREHRRLDSDRAVSVAGQSRGWITAVQAAQDRYQQEKIACLSGVAPMGHTPIPGLQLAPTDMSRLLGLTVGELADRRVQQQDAYARAVKQGIARNALEHTIGNSLASRAMHPWTFADRAIRPLAGEIHELFTTDVTDAVVELSQHVGATTLLACRHDRFAPGEQIVGRFADVPAFAGQVLLADLTHVGSLVDQELLPDLYGMLLPAADSESIGLAG